MIENEQQEQGKKHDCTIVVFCDDTARDVWEDKEGWLVTYPGQTTNRIAKKYSFLNQNYLFKKHRIHCGGDNVRKHSVTIRFEVDNFSEIHFVSLGIDDWN